MEPESQQRSEHRNAGTCPLCHQKAGIISREHSDSPRTHQADWQEMAQLGAVNAKFQQSENLPQM